ALIRSITAGAGVPPACAMPAIPHIAYSSERIDLRPGLAFGPPIEGPPVGLLEADGGGVLVEDTASPFPRAGPGDIAGDSPRRRLSMGSDERQAAQALVAAADDREQIAEVGQPGVRPLAAGVGEAVGRRD